VRIASHDLLKRQAGTHGDFKHGLAVADVGQRDGPLSRLGLCSPPPWG
jgi:hypothetical protein